MKVYNEKEGQKSWGIRLIDEGDGDASLSAVDASTGMLITHLIIFTHNGRVQPSVGIPDRMQEQGYNPYQHNNGFREDGSIVIYGLRPIEPIE